MLTPASARAPETAAKNPTKLSGKTMSNVIIRQSPSNPRNFWAPSLVSSMTQVVSRSSLMTTRALARALFVLTMA